MSRQAGQPHSGDIRRLFSFSQRTKARLLADGPRRRSKAALGSLAAGRTIPAGGVLSFSKGAGFPLLCCSRSGGSLRKGEGIPPAAIAIGCRAEGESSQIPLNGNFVCIHPSPSFRRGAFLSAVTGFWPQGEKGVVLPGGGVYNEDILKRSLYSGIPSSHASF